MSVRGTGRKIKERKTRLYIQKKTFNLKNKKQMKQLHRPIKLEMGAMSF